jgi:hypothetical protein
LARASRESTFISLFKPRPFLPQKAREAQRAELFFFGEDNPERACLNGIFLRFLCLLAAIPDVA